MSAINITSIQPAHTDDRGSITDLINTNEAIYHIGLITFTPGATRANHYHKVSTQYDYILEGEIELATKDVDADGIDTVTLKAGDLVSIPPNTIHAYRAITPTSMIDMTTTSRDADGYEDDTYRIEPIL